MPITVMTRVLTLIELRSITISHDSGEEDLEIKCATFEPADWLGLLTYPYGSGKNLVEFLKIYQLDILNRAPIDDPRTLQLEEQNFLEYLNKPWYLQNGEIKVLSPEEILRFAIEIQAVTAKRVYNYVLKPRGEYLYKLCENEFKRLGNTQESVQHVATE